MATVLLHRTYSVLRSFSCPAKIIAFRSKKSIAKRKHQAKQSPGDFVYFLHNHVVPLHSFEEAVEKLKVYSVKEKNDVHQTVTMCMKCQGLNKVSLH